MNEKKELIRQLENALELLKSMPEETPSGKGTNGQYDLRLIQPIARKNRFEKHYLTTCDSSVRSCYIQALLMLLDGTQDTEDAYAQLLYIGRIVAAFDEQVDLNFYAVKKIKAEEAFWNDFSDFIHGEAALCFAVDALVVANLAGKSRDQSFRLAAEIFPLLGLEQKYLLVAGGIAKGILQNNLFRFLDAVQQSLKINYDRFLCYFKDYSDFHIASSLKEGSKFDGSPGKVIFVDLDFKPDYSFWSSTLDLYYGTEKMYLHQFKATENIFYRCNFREVRELDAGRGRYIFANNTNQSGMLSARYTCPLSEKIEESISMKEDEVTEIKGAKLDEVKRYHV